MCLFHRISRAAIEVVLLGTWIQADATDAATSATAVVRNRRITDTWKVTRIVRDLVRRGNWGRGQGFDRITAGSMSP